MKIIIKIISICYLAFTFTNCGTSKNKNHVEAQPEIVETLINRDQDMETERPVFPTYTLKSMTNLPEGKNISELFPRNHPTLTIDHYASILTGSTGCNNYRANYKMEGKTFKIDENIFLTKKYCEGVEERLFIDELKKINGYSISGITLNLMNNDAVILVFEKQ